MTVLSIWLYVLSDEPELAVIALLVAALVGVGLVATLRATWRLIRRAVG